MDGYFSYGVWLNSPIYPAVSQDLANSGRSWIFYVRVSRVTNSQYPEDNVLVSTLS